MKRRLRRLMAAAQVVILFVLVAGILLIGIGGATAILQSGATGSTKQGAIGDWLATGAFLLALIAAIVGILAYRVSILKPDLRADVRFGHGFDGLVVSVTKPDAFGRRSVIGMQPQIHFHLHNYGPVSARNPALKVKLRGAMFGPVGQTGWAFGDHLHGLGGFASAQWDGGADYSIHPHWGRDLPTLHLPSVGGGFRGGPAIYVEIVADGFYDGYQLPVVFKETDLDYPKKA